MRTFQQLRWSALFLSVALFCLGTTQACSQTVHFKPLNVSATKQSRVVGKVAPYQDKNRFRIYAALNKEYLKLWDRGGGAVMAMAKTRTFNGFPFLQLEDRAKDGIADFYVYYPSRGGGNTQEFGAFFDLAGDGAPDWIVFYGGSLFAEGQKLAWWNHHAIDRNNDSKFDTLVIDRIDMNDNGLIEKGAAVWIFDANFDGRIDMAEHVINGKVKRIKPSKGRIDTKMLSRNRMLRIGEPFYTLFDKIARDISSALD